MEISIGTFPDELKIADIVPVFKKEDQDDKTNYRTMSLLPLISKIFENFFYYQIEDFPKKNLSQNFCGFRKGRSTQHALLNLLKNWQKCLDKSGVVGTVLMDLSKAYAQLSGQRLVLGNQRFIDTSKITFMRGNRKVKSRSKV